jgi:hypothetical protein
VLEAGRAEIASLLGMPAGVVFTHSATAALAAWPLRPGDTVAAAPSEWGPNLAAFSNHGLAVQELPVHPAGIIDLDHLEPALAGTRPAVVHLTLAAVERARLVAEPTGAAGIAAVMQQPGAFEPPVVVVVPRGQHRPSRPEAGAADEGDR